MPGARLVLAAAIGYAGLTTLVTWQALRGQSIVAPDGTTLAAGAGLLLATAAAAATGLVGARRQRRSTPTR